MLKTTWIALCFLSIIGVAAARAQVGDPAGPQRERKPTGLLNEDNLTATGETVPHPGVPQASGTTVLDRAIQKRDDRLERGICSNC
jgi:hypothetical protein